MNASAFWDRKSSQITNPVCFISNYQTRRKWTSSIKYAWLPECFKTLLLSIFHIDNLIANRMVIFCRCCFHKTQWMPQVVPFVCHCCVPMQCQYHGATRASPWSSGVSLLVSTEAERVTGRKQEENEKSLKMRRLMGGRTFWPVHWRHCWFKKWSLPPSIYFSATCSAYVSFLVSVSASRRSTWKLLLCLQVTCSESSQFWGVDWYFVFCRI